jgi:hypothetical protein
MCFRIALAFAIRSHFLGNIYAQAMGKVGGVNQRKQRRLEQPAEQPAHQQHRLPEPNSPLGLALLSKWAWGVLSATNVQELAHAAVLSGAEADDLVSLSSLGSYGQQPGNCHRDLVRKYCKDLWSPEREQRAFKEDVDACLSHYSWLAKHAAENGWQQWSIVPKHHFLAHLPDMATHLAPRASWTYPGESMVGTITSLASACTASTSARQLTKPLMAKYRIAMHLRHSMNLCQS